VEFTRRTLLGSAVSLPLFAQASRSGAIPNRHTLSGRVTAASLQRSLKLPWKPYSTLADREAWSALPADLRDKLIKAGEAVSGKPYAPLPASVLLEYARNGNRSHFENIQSSRRNHLRDVVLAECVEAKGRFLDDIGDGVWAICEETFWGIPAHLGAQKRGVGLPDVTEPIIELFSAETAALLAWTHYLAGPQLARINPLLRERLEAEIERRILSVYRERSDFGWMGLNGTSPVNNWNPWINSNVLTCALLMDRDPARRAQTVHKVLTSTDRFLDSYHDDGGCDEGPSYWGRAGAALFECLDLVRSATGGNVNYFDIPLVKQIGAYIYRVHIAGDWFVNFADAPAKVHPNGALVYRFGAATGDEDLKAFGAHLVQSRGPQVENLGRALPEAFGLSEMRKAPAREPLTREAWMPGIQVAAARVKQGSTGGFYFAALGGHNAESHNHNDVGNFVVFCDGQPVLIDAGVETYTAKTFSAQRYDIWTMQSAYHNLPAINGVMQAAGRQYAARDVSFHSDDTAAEFVADIAAAYPKEAGVDKWIRTIRLERGSNRILVNDRYALRARDGKVTMSLMTPRQVRTDSGRFDLGGVSVTLDGPAAPGVEVQEVDTTDARLRPVWGPRIVRILIGWTNMPASGELRWQIERKS
jgi:hypothetical protein